MSDVVRFSDSQVEMARQALEMRRKGLDTYTIAKRLGLSVNKTTGLLRSTFAEARALVGAAEHRELLDMEVDRLDALQAALWDDAIGGDVRAAEACLKLIMARSRLLGLDAGEDAGATTVVVAGERRAYLQTLVALSGGDSSA